MHTLILMAVRALCALWIPLHLARVWSSLSQVQRLMQVLCRCLLMGWAGSVRHRFLGLSSLLANEAWCLSSRGGSVIPLQGWAIQGLLYTETCPHTMHGSEMDCFAPVRWGLRTPPRRQGLGLKRRGCGMERPEWWGVSSPSWWQWEHFRREWEGAAYCKDRGEGQLLRVHLPLHMCVSVSL